jgi:hypothetical protein
MDEPRVVRVVTRQDRAALRDRQAEDALADAQAQSTEHRPLAAVGNARLVCQA